MSVSTIGVGLSSSFSSKYENRAKKEKTLHPFAVPRQPCIQRGHLLFFVYDACGSLATRAVRLYCTRCSFTQTRRRQEPSSQATPGHPPTRSQQRSSEAAPGFAQTTFEKL